MTSKRSPAVWRVAYTAVVLALLLIGWEVLAGRFSGSFLAGADADHGDDSGGAPPNVPVFADATHNDKLEATLAALPPRAAPRVLCLGTSQIRVVKDGGRGRSLPFQLYRLISSGYGPCEVVDFSAGAQQVAEGTLVLLGSADRLKPDLVLIGVALSSLQHVLIRETLLESFTSQMLARRVRENLPADADRNVVAALLTFQDGRPQGPSERGKTIQQRTDDRIADLLADHFHMVGHRQEMFDRLLDKPLRRDLVTYFKREVQSVTVARTLQISPGYQPSLLALSVMSRFCRKRGIHLVVAHMPYESTREPIAYLPADVDRLLADLRAQAGRQGHLFIDLAHLLGPEYFDKFVDGSWDSVHMKAAGHAAVGQALANVIGPALFTREDKGKAAGPSSGPAPGSI